MRISAAAVGVGAAVYTVNKAEDAAEDKANTDAMMRRESMSLAEAEANAGRQRERGQAASRELANSEAEASQVNTMESIAASDKLRMEQEKILAAKQGEVEYASKFKPGQGGEGDDSASDFLVPKVSSDTGLVRNASDTGGSGLVTPLAFNV